MRRLAALFTTLVLALAVMTTSATSPDDLASLADGFPEDTIVFASIRTDQGYVDDLNRILDRALQFVPAGMVPPVNVNLALDLLVQDLGLQSFEGDVRPWLGDTAAAGVVVPEGSLEASEDVGILIAFAGEGQAAFDALGATILENEDFAQSERDGFIVLADDSQFGQTFIAFGEDVIYIASDEALIPFTPLETSLATSGALDALDNLPADDYNALIVNNTTSIFGDLDALLGTADVPGFFAQFANLELSQVFGFTILDGDSLVVDVTQTFNREALADLGVEQFVADPVDLSFAERIPADAPLLIHGTDLGPATLNSIAALRAFDEQLAESGGLSSLVDPMGTMLSEQERAIVDQFQLDYALGLVNFAFAGVSGLSLESDFLPPLDGDFALYLRVVEPEGFFFLPVLPDLAVLFSSSDPDGLSNIVTGFTDSADAYGLNLSTEAYGNGEALVIPASQLLPFNVPALDLLFGSSDDLLAFGTRGAVERALETDGESVADTEAFATASTYFLPDSQQVWYLDSGPIFDVVDTLAAQGIVPSIPLVEQIYTASSLIESASITVNQPSTTGATVRFVLTLADEPRLPVARTQAVNR